MKLYLDSADVSAWDEYLPTGIFHGLTTNPLLAQRAGLEYETINWNKMANRATKLGAKELHVQVAGDFESYVDFSGRLYDIGKEVGVEIVIKIPLIEGAIRISPDIKKLGGRILMTACYDAKQMFIAKALEADFIAPYFGRMVEAGMDAEGHLSAMLAMNEDNAKPCSILVASLRSATQMVDLARSGHDTFTIAPSVAKELLSTEQSLAAFEEFERAASSN
jgi:transaldolase